MISQYVACYISTGGRGLKENSQRERWLLIHALLADDSPLCHEILAKKILPVVRYYSYIEITRRAHQTLWREYEHLQAMFDNFAMQHIRDQDDIYPVFRELFQKQSSTSNA